MEINFSRTNGRVDELLDEILQLTEVHHPETVREIVLNALKAGREVDYLADLKMMRTTLREMRNTTRLFGTHRERKKVTIFGSARTSPEEPIYQKCVTFARQLSRLGYMVITGGGPGIMQAGNEGAGPENSFAVNIRLPFEQETNPVMEKSRNVITYKYFFNRKVAFVKESDAIAVFPGGFGTLDEAMEVFTLIQTGKTAPKPLVLVDDESGYWDRWFDFIKAAMLGRGLISAEDFAIFTITRSTEEAIAAIEGFYHIYHSMRFVDGNLVIRLTKELTDEQLDTLSFEFPEVRLPGTLVTRTTPLPEEADEPDLLSLPRIVVRFDHQHYGLLIAFIGRINTF